jgi:hypothetical protein
MANNLDAFIPELWERPVIERFRQSNLAVAVCCNTNYEGTISRMGDTVHVATTSSVSLRDYARGQTVVYEDATPTDETLTIDRAKYGAINVDDLDRAQNNQDALGLYTQELGIAMANSMDTFAFSFHASSLTANQISNSGSALNIVATSAGTTHVYDLLVQAGLNLDVQNVPRDRRWVIVTPYFYSLLQKDTVYFIKGTDLSDNLIATAQLGGMTQTGSEAAARGFVGQAAGFDVYMSNNLAGDGAGNYYCVYGQSRPISLASQIAGRFEAIRRTDTFGNSVRALMLYGGKVFAETSKSLGRIYVDNS